MKMTRLYKRGRMEDVTKAFKKGIRRFKDEKSTLIMRCIPGFWSQEDRVDEAVALLFEAKSKTKAKC